MTERSNLSPLPRRYKCILADPPWDIHQKGKRGAIQHYPLMSLANIKAMPVADLAEDDSHCWVWTTNATLRDGYDVLEAWGFVPRSPLTWVKTRLGLGQYLRNMTEHVILGTRGKAPVNFRGQPTWMLGPVQNHSHKPEETYAIIERVSSGPYLELFAGVALEKCAVRCPSTLLAALILQITGDTGMAFASWAFTAALSSTIYAGEATFASWVVGGLGLCALALTVRGVRKLLAGMVVARKVIGGNE